MRTALLSCLHANLEATQAVLDDLRHAAVDRVICLGDLVGYGADPMEVVEICYSFDVVLRGNHDEGAIDGTGRFSPIARPSLNYARSLLRPGILADARKKRAWNFLKGLPVWFQESDVSCVHASPRDPTWEYVLRTDCMDLFGRPSPKIKSVFRRIDRLCFAGHTHDPGVITESGQFLRPLEFDSIYRLRNDRRYFINVGSVGQPRDGDRRACYAIFDGRSVEFRRVDYDYERAMEKALGIDPDPPTSGTPAKRR